jgi:hyaluronate lyase
MWQDHGVNPSGAEYSYLVVPGASAARTKQLSKGSGLLVLRNSASAQAVVSVPLGMTLANFWKPDRVADLQADTPCSVIRRMRGRDVELAISDPTQLATTVHLTVLLPGLRVVEADPGVTTVRTLLSTRITVDVSGAAGATRYLTLRFQ